MRHEASLIEAMEAMSRSAFRIARELALNSRSGLTVRFLSKKLDLPEEEIEYLVDVNPKLLFTDITKVKIVPEGITAVKRILEGLESRGDVPSLFSLIKSLPPHDFRRFEERIGLENLGPRKAAAVALLDNFYVHPDSVIEYVAACDFSEAAQEIFDIVWQSKEGVLSASQLRAITNEPEYKVERGLTELIEGFALFEMFRFDAEDTLVRMVGMLREIRQYRDAESELTTDQGGIRPARGTVTEQDVRGLEFSDRVCRLLATVAARPVRLRGDGELFREDRRRLEEICTEDDAPSLNTCLWAAQGVGWLGRVDNELRAGELDSLTQQDRLSRHEALFGWLTGTQNELASRRTLVEMLDDLKPGAWYYLNDFVRYAMQVKAQKEQPVLRNAGGHWRYVIPSASPNAEMRLARALQETMLWLGVVDTGQAKKGAVFRVSDLGLFLLTGQNRGKVAAAFPPRDSEIVVQPNFDIVVPAQDIDPLLTVLLDQFAERTSTGHAMVYRVSKESFTQALQDDRDGDAFVDFLITHNRGAELPKNVMTTLEDWHGGLKRVRLRTIHVIESDDPLVLADLSHRRNFAKYINTVDPHKMLAYKGVKKSDLAKLLEKAGVIVDT